MACPPEDGNGFEGMGNRSYQEWLDSALAVKDGGTRKYKKMCAECSTALSYKDRSDGECPSRVVLFCIAGQRSISILDPNPSCISSTWQSACHLYNPIINATADVPVAS